MLLCLLILPLVLSFPGMRRGESLITPGLFLMLASASLLGFSLLSASVCGHASRVVQQQARYNEMMEWGDFFVETRTGAWRMPRPMPARQFE